MPPPVPDTVVGTVTCSLTKSCFFLLAYRSCHRYMEA